MLQKPLLDFWRGCWQMVRIINHQGRQSQNCGRATFVSIDENNLLCYENLLVYCPETQTDIAAYRQYQYSRWPSGQLVKYFRDQLGACQLFYPVNFINNGLQALGIYRCPPDLYRAAYQFFLPKSFILTISVDGPQKKYTIKQVFEKLD